MPYQSQKDLPKTVKELPDNLQIAWMKAFNAAWDTYDGDEEAAFRVAWSAVNKKRKKDT